MDAPASPVYSDASLSFSAPSRQRMSRRIDSTKLKTKTCRYVSTRRCPYAHNCAFVHVDDDHNAPRVAEPASPTTRGERSGSFTSDSRPPAGLAQLDASLFDEAQLGVVNTDSFESTPPPPPSYEEAVHDESMILSEYMCPPPYPSRFRYDPYSYSGVFIEE